MSLRLEGTCSITAAPCSSLDMPQALLTVFSWRPKSQQTASIKHAAAWGLPLHFSLSSASKLSPRPDDSHAVSTWLLSPQGPGLSHHGRQLPSAEQPGRQPHPCQTAPLGRRCAASHCAWGCPASSGSARCMRTLAFSIGITHSISMALKASAAAYLSGWSSRGGMLRLTFRVGLSCMVRQAPLHSNARSQASLVQCIDDYHPYFSLCSHQRCTGGPR